MVVYTVTSDGTPFYGDGNSAGFPTWTYTHTPAAVSNTYYIPGAPTLAGTAASPVYTPLGLANSLGVALDGVPFDPLTSTCETTNRSASNACSFRLEGRLQTDPSTPGSPYATKRLGFDTHNGHSQSNPNAYHYHAIPCGISWGSGTAAITCNPMASNSANAWNNLPSTATGVGYARDGYPIVVQKGVYASYSVVTAAATGRPTTNTTDTSNALGNFSADMTTLVTSGTTFTQATLPANKTLGDFVYTGPSTLGTSTTALGLCNEAPNTNPDLKTLGGETAAYVYYLTPNFPMVPRCLIGVTDGATETTQGFYHSGGLD
ncbi:MAG: YHYH protein [Magnetococcales bacterium]|nr:YHYH protein [Magnetococcales bacterium]MBF0347847.1 YHYH protein [Magnetococcales bacterium]MBF0631171.1 YHYH protein [Magnetococcales bacterium]